MIKIINLNNIIFSKEDFTKWTDNFSSNKYIGGNKQYYSDYDNPYNTIKEYVDYLFRSGLIYKVKKLKNKNLGCFCVGDNCHAVILKKLLEECEDLVDKYISLRKEEPTQYKIQQEEIDVDTSEYFDFERCYGYDLDIIRKYADKEGISCNRNMSKNHICNEIINKILHELRSKCMKSNLKTIKKYAKSLGIIMYDHELSGDQEDWCNILFRKLLNKIKLNKNKEYK